MKLVCPNCGERYDDLDIKRPGEQDDVPEGFRTGELGKVRCGQCAQAGVRPRDLYVLVEVTA